jgi:hypothetical protein
VIVQDLAGGPEIALCVQDGAIGGTYHVPIPTGLVRYDVAELLVHELRSHREQAGVERWRLCLSGPWLLS